MRISALQSAGVLLLSIPSFPCVTCATRPGGEEDMSRTKFAIQLLSSGDLKDIPEIGEEENVRTYACIVERGPDLWPHGRSLPPLCGKRIAMEWES